MSNFKEVIMQIWKWITSLFADASYQDSLEHFISRKKPRNGTEVEYWIRVYHMKNGGGIAL
jgi:hypothetical protein